MISVILDILYYPVDILYYPVLVEGKPSTLMILILLY